MATVSRKTSSMVRPFAVLLVAVVVAFGTTGCQRPDARDRVVVFVHGWSAFGAGSDCKSSFGSLESSLRSEGFTGPMVTVGYYDNDENCDVNLRSWGNVSNGTSWKTISQAFSAYIYETYTQHGVTVDVVGHSMGGLIIRGAVYGSSTGQAGFAPPLLVEDAVTLAAPHNGAAFYTHACLWGQCSGLKPGSSELNWVNADKNPQGKKGTEWTTFGSTNDLVVPSASARSLDLPAEREITSTSVGHSDYQSDQTIQVQVAAALAKPNL